MTDTKIIENMTKDQFREYWNELKQTRFDSYYFRELYEKIRKMNPNLVLPEEETMEQIKSKALSVAFWEENWEQINEKRVNRGGVDYSIFFRDNNRNNLRLEIPHKSKVG